MKSRKGLLDSARLGLGMVLVVAGVVCVTRPSGLRADGGDGAGAATAPVVEAAATTEPLVLSPGQYTEERGNTKPSEFRELSFDVAGTLATINVVPGQHVPPGFVLMQMDTRAEEKELADLKVDMDSDLPIEAAIAQQQVKDAKLKRTQEEHVKGVATDAELDEATADAELARLEVLKAREDKSKAEIKYEKQAIRLETMKKIAPDDSNVKEWIVLSVDRKAGQVVDPSKPVCTIVSNDPLYVEAYLPTAQAQMLHEANPGKGVSASSVGVRYVVNDVPTGATHAAWVIFRTPQADAGSQHQLVRFEMPNPEGQDSGQIVDIMIPKSSEVAGTGNK